MGGGPGGRVTALTANGVPVEANSTYRIVVNRFFMTDGGDGYAILQDACARPGGYCRDTGILDLDIVAGEFSTRAPVVRRIEGRIVVQ